MELRVNYAYSEEAVKGQDRILADPDLRVFGVFDGAGGYFGSDIAAETAAETVRKYYEETENERERPKTARDALLAADRAVDVVQRTTATEMGGMATTATIAHIFEENGQPVISYAHVGDSRIYRLHGDSLQQITKDEGEGHGVDQFIGRLHEVKHFGKVALQSGDRLMLCSDGVTGDYGDEILSDDEIQNALYRKNSPQVAADTLVNISRKHDDKSAVVIDVD